MIKVFGHKSPDTDTVCSAIIWAWYLNEHTSMDAKPFVLGELTTETKFVLHKWEVETPQLLEKVSSDDKIVIVDTNNPKELPEGVNNAEILQIIDHHKLTGGLTSDTPIDITMRPIACTATILHDLMGDDIDIPEHIAGLMLSCILSDTLEFRSPTTTPHDKNVAETLAKKLDVDVTKYAMEMFDAKSDISDLTDKGLIHLDSKKFDIGSKNLLVSVVETTSPTMILKRKEGLLKAIETSITEESDVDEVLFFIVDILNEEATVLIYNDVSKQIVETSFGVTVEGDTHVLPGVVSRKKQIMPVLKY